MKIFIDIETIPDQSENAIDRIKKDIKVSVPSDLTKPKLMAALDCDDKYKTVAELKDMWIEKFGEEQKSIQATEKWLKTSFDGTYGQIVCICARTEKGRMFESCLGDEREILLSFSKWLAFIGVTHPEYVAHNKKFDLPFLFHRFVINGVSPLHSFDPHSKRHYCTMEAWAGYGGKISMDRLAGVLGLQGKTEGMCGADVYPAFCEGRLDDIKKYCAQDVEVLHNIYNKINFIN